MKKVGFTTTIPCEVIFAAGLEPVDLNNVFIMSEDAEKEIEKAEIEGFPRNICAWIKGIYSAVMKSDIDVIVGVVEGDCSNTRGLLDVLKLGNKKFIPFSYPISKEYEVLKGEFIKLMSYFNVTEEKVLQVKCILDEIRKRLNYLDELTWYHDKATGFENHFYLVSSSDFFGDYYKFKKELDFKIVEIEKRQKADKNIRLGYIGVPPVFPDLFQYIESLDARVVYNEVQRQFSLIDGINNNDIVDVYLNHFTYPYDIEGRINDIKLNIERRNIHGIIHYVQSFCYRSIEDIVLRKKLDIPILTLEGDRPGELDARTKIRIESYIDMLKS